MEATDFSAASINITISGSVSYFIATILRIDFSAALRVGSSIVTSGLSFSKQLRMFSSVTIFI